MNRRAMLARLGLTVAAGVVMDPLELLDRLAPRRLYVPGGLYVPPPWPIVLDDSVFAAACVHPAGAMDSLSLTWVNLNKRWLTAAMAKYPPTYVAAAMGRTA